MMMQYKGYWWPEGADRGAFLVEKDHLEEIDWFLGHVDRRDCVIQAGGNTGIYPLNLALNFRHVLTVEPDSRNFRCLQKNMDVRDSLGRVDARMAAFGDDEGYGKIIEVEPGNCGAHRIGMAKEGEGIPILTIDSFGLDPNAIWLDVEGYELQALKGAVETILRSSPVIVLEMKQLGRVYGYDDTETATFLTGLGYSLADKRANDYVFKRNMA